MQFLSNNDYSNPYFANPILTQQIGGGPLVNFAYIPVLGPGTPFNFLVYVMDQAGNLFNETLPLSLGHLSYSGS